MKIWITLLLVFLISAITRAQSFMVVHKSDGSIDRVQIAEIQKITFDLTAETGNRFDRISMKKFENVFSRIFPNPFGTRIQYTVAEESPVNISVWNMMGRNVATVFKGNKTPGKYAVVWNGVNDSGKKLARGSYVVRVRIGNVINSENLFILK